MERPAPGLRRAMMTSLASRIGFAVFAATLVSALAVAGTSALAVRTFLRAQTEGRVPEAAVRARDRLELWYSQRALDVVIFAHSDIVVGGLARASRGASPERAAERKEVEQYLGYVREGLPVYSAIFALDGQGRPIARTGAAGAIAAADARTLAAVGEPVLSGVLVAEGGERIQVASAPVAFADRTRKASVHAVIPLAELAAQLRAAIGEETGRLHVYDAQGGLVASSLEGASDRLAPELARAAEGAAVEYSAADGVRVVASAMPLAKLGWQVVFERDYGSTFAAIASILTRMVGMNVGIALVLAGLAFGVARSMLRPLHQLTQCAKRLRDGEVDVALPVVSADHEVGTLARSFAEMVESLTRANEVLEQLAITDGLTKIHNHRYFQDQLANALRRADSAGMELALVLIDIDDFKALNDRFGHATGDRVLEGLAQVLNASVRESDVLARYGGEEFALLALETDVETAVALAEQVRLAVHEHAFHDADQGAPIHVTVSIGVAAYRGDRRRFFADADRALYAAKHAGKDCVEVARD
ncbi:MAG: diguanylate cyclase [Myxococcota bacterium]